MTRSTRVLAWSKSSDGESSAVAARKPRPLRARVCAHSRSAACPSVLYLMIKRGPRDARSGESKMLVDADVESRIEKMRPTDTRREVVHFFAFSVLGNPRNEPSPPTLAEHHAAHCVGDRSDADQSVKIPVCVCDRSGRLERTRSRNDLRSMSAARPPQLAPCPRLLPARHRGRRGGPNH